MNYKPHLDRIQNQYGILDGYDDATDFDKCVILLKKNHCTYKQIQKWLGNPSKELIKESIQKYIPELLEVYDNKNKLKCQQNLNEKRLIGLLKTSNNNEYDLDEFGLTNFKIVNGNLYFVDETTQCYKFIEYDERTQLSIIYNVARILNIDLN